MAPPRRAIASFGVRAGSTRRGARMAPATACAKPAATLRYIVPEDARALGIHAKYATSAVVAPNMIAAEPRGCIRHRIPIRVLTRSPMGSSACVPSKRRDCSERSACSSQTALGATLLIRAEKSSESPEARRRNNGPIHVLALVTYDELAAPTLGFPLVGSTRRRRSGSIARSIAARPIDRFPTSSASSTPDGLRSSHCASRSRKYQLP
jgi:hypothetical protein